MSMFPRPGFPRTALAKRHQAVIDSAPEEMKANLRRIAANACSRAYDETEDLQVYLDSEDFYFWGRK